MLKRAGGVVGLLVVAVALLAGGCGETPVSECTPEPVARLDAIDPDDETLPFGFPLSDLPALTRSVMTRFCESGQSRNSGRLNFHAAEDYRSPPGTDVYAVAEGNVVYSGPMGGYGWLIIVDHSEMNLYSLYGHLSPSRWKTEPGPVAKGELIAHLGDYHENGETPPHLHFGIRAGQRGDYPGGGFASPSGGLWEKWRFDLLLFGLVAIGTIAGAAFAAIKHKPRLLVFYGTALLMVCVLNLGRRGPAIVMQSLAVIAFLFITLGIVSHIRDTRADRPRVEGPAPAGPRNLKDAASLARLCIREKEVRTCMLLRRST